MASKGTGVRLQTISADLITIIQEELELPNDFKINSESLIARIPGWDSVAWISVIAALEKHFDSTFPLDRIDEVRTVQDLVEIINAR